MEKEAIHTQNAPEAIGPYSQAVRVPGFCFTSGQIPLDPATGELIAGDISVQAARVLDNLKAVLTEAGLTFADVVKTTVFLTDIGDFAAVNAVYASYFEEPFPARSAVQVAKLPKGAAVEIECICAG